MTSVNKRHFLTFILIALAVLLPLVGADGNSELIREFRIPRAVLAFAVGSSLALSGLLLQLILQNSLCEPYILGLPAGGTIGFIVGSILRVPTLVAGFSFSAFLGTLGFGAIIVRIARRESASLILLTGVMLNFVGSSVVTLWMTLSDPTQSQAAIRWLFGDLSRAEWTPTGVLLGLTVVSLIYFWRRARDLDSLLLGEATALALGVPIVRLRREVLFVTALLLSLSVSLAGTIGFVGLMVPHWVRGVSGSLHRRTLPLVFLWGGLLLVIADSVSRIIFQPYEIPIGVMTSFIGAPFFIWVLFKRRGVKDS
ncbi:MAG: iron ABC transporter permease [Proteobacteria bacterium]|nr:MAG: iron ABC transporter permease [Pseudomonadota bacterium]